MNQCRMILKSPTFTTEQRTWHGPKGSPESIASKLVFEKLSETLELLWRRKENHIPKFIYGGLLELWWGRVTGVGMALRKVGAMAKPDCIISSDGKNLTIKTESTLKTTQFSCNLGEKFEETTADGRKTQTVCNFTDGALVQHQEWDGKESTITRKLENGKLVVECVMNNVTCTRVYEKVE
ncbi:fatty acid-binding protein 5 isoform X1 [Meles meles]|uniref:fatty acid-binding protein 5 isoform X1 n=1 Tax=Meles meles TaxID=9662 RepID=UPI001E69B514|nr:fatty acid-binding protein 5 isoform X1 [Meles meles]XP_045881433.1 fatty acid-binding protein 5 isoform X1 [Meles meles]